MAGERCDPLLAPLPEGSQVCSGAELHVGVGERDQLGDPQPGLGGGQQQRVIAAAGPGGAVRALEQRFDLSGARNVTIRFSARLDGIARTRAIRPACSGWRSAQ